MTRDSFPRRVRTVEELRDQYPSLCQAEEAQPLDLPDLADEAECIAQSYLDNSAWECLRNTTIALTTERDLIFPLRLSGDTNEHRAWWDAFNGTAKRLLYQQHRQYPGSRNLLPLARAGQVTLLLEASLYLPPCWVGQGGVNATQIVADFTYYLCRALDLPVGTVTHTEFGAHPEANAVKQGIACCLQVTEVRP